MEEKEFQEIKGRSEEIKRFLGRGSYVHTLNDDVPKLVAEVEELRAEQDQLRGEIRSLKEECSALITESDEHLREMKEFRAVVQEVMEDVSGMFSSFNKLESPDQLDRTLSVSTVGHTNNRQTMNGNGRGDEIFRPSNGNPLADGLSSGSVNLNSERAIPDPSTIVLLGSDLRDLGSFCQRKKVAD